MRYFTYVLSSINFKKSYVGSTDNLERRLEEHNTGLNYYTKRYAPWIIISKEEYETLGEARSREKYLKPPSGRRLILKKLFE